MAAPAAPAAPPPATTRDRYPLVLGLVALALAVVIGTLLLRGDRTHPTIVEVASREAPDQYLIGELTVEFSRPMSTEAVAAALSVEIADTGYRLPGELSWTGNRMTWRATVVVARGQDLLARLPAAGTLDATGRPLADDWTHRFALPEPDYLPGYGPGGAITTG